MSEERNRDVAYTGTSAVRPILGANLNGRPYRLTNKLELIDASNTTWVRAFLDIRDKLTNGIHPERDPDVLALRQAALERDCKLIVSLKWDFKANWGDKEPARVPPPGSKGERELCQCAAQYLGSIGAPVEIVILGNEPMWETLDEDIKVGKAPIIRFTRTVKDHLVEHGDHGDSTYLVGAFNRAHNNRTRTKQFPHFYHDMFELVREDGDISGVDLHIHYNAFEQAERTVAVTRSALPDAMITATEFSPVWRYARHIDTPMSDWETGERFALDYDLPADMTAVEYFEDAKRNPRTPGEIADFYDAMPWYNANHLEDMYDLFSDFGVSIGTFGFLQGVDMRNEDWTKHWLPFHINFLFQPALMQTEHGLDHTAHPHYIEDYRERAG